MLNNARAGCPCHKVGERGQPNTSSGVYRRSALSGFVCAANCVGAHDIPLPDPTPVHEPRTDRIQHEVANLSEEVGPIPDQMVVVLRLPKRSMAADGLVRPKRSEALPRVQNARQRMLLRRLNDNMHMIRHDALRDEAVPHGIKVKQCAVHKFRDLRSSHPAAPDSCVEVLVHPRGMKLVESTEFMG